MAHEDLHREFFNATKIGDIEKVEVLIKNSNLDINHIIDSSYGFLSFLYLPTKNGHTEIVEIILKHPKINVNNRMEAHSPLLNTLLRISVARDHFDIVKLLVPFFSAQINHVDRYQYPKLDIDQAHCFSTVLDFSIQSNNINITKYLLENGASKFLKSYYIRNYNNFKNSEPLKLVNQTMKNRFIQQATLEQLCFKIIKDSNVNIDNLFKYIREPLDIWYENIEQTWFVCPLEEEG